jgi:hypothetical protein
VNVDGILPLGQSILVSVVPVIKGTDAVAPLPELVPIARPLVPPLELIVAYRPFLVMSKIIPDEVPVLISLRGSPAIYAPHGLGIDIL